MPLRPGIMMSQMATSKGAFGGQRETLRRRLQRSFCLISALLQTKLQHLT